MFSKDKGMAVSHRTLDIQDISLWLSERICFENFSSKVYPGNRVLIIGKNGTGKSTLLKALLHDPSVKVGGDWSMPPQADIGYLDQHYSTLDAELTVFQVIQTIAPTLQDNDIRKLLNDFLFRKPEELSKKVYNLSGGEQARLSLAQIAAASYYLLLFDEVTNNVDLSTRTHIVEVLKAYPGAMIIVTHDPTFLQELEVAAVYEVVDGTLKRASL